MNCLLHSSIVASFAAALLAPGFGAAQVARVEVHPLPSTTLTDQELLTGQRAGKPALIGAELRIPRMGTDRLPAVVLLHGSGGGAGFVDDWASLLNSMSVATFLVDSFTGRGVVSVINDQSQLPRLVQMEDAYRALELLAKHPRIDPGRIALMGFSKGGQVVLCASLKRFQRMAPAGVSFAAYIAFYPGCSTSYIGDDDVVAKPIRIFHGTADDWLPVAPCRAYVERLRKAGKDIQLTEYAGAHHVFDWQLIKVPQKLAQAQTARGCRLQEAPDGRIVNADTRQPFTWADPCVQRGATIAYHPEAAAEARKAVKEFVAAVLKPQ
jgi:dienelactone hydrolase